ncbi:hypothetical protein K7X08_002349 [Anisodus acutangulus]|uniref:Dof zinc finger protein n=1 Tax=Anisodus acutangulus TaxID=402998 RepID=A0A9Q1R5E2_9SOLA|nr:hypothetical protein K7X08_002349 [Anisodus acutangulus]
MLPYHPRPMIMIERTRNSNIEKAPNCPRCASTNTKFCYYNNYSLSQPRYFCKACRRYWTKGGSLRNVPVGGGCRKSRRSKSSRKDDNTLQTPSPSLSEAAGADIDLADVFAKYLNQGTTNNDHDDQDNNILQESQDYSSIGASLSDSPNSFENESLLDETIMGNFHDNPCGNFLKEDQLHEGVSIQVGQPEEFDHYNTSFAWQQPMMQFQDFGSILEDDHQLKNSTPNLACSDNNNYTSFDLSNYI